MAENDIAGSALCFYKFCLYVAQVLGNHFLSLPYIKHGTMHKGVQGLTLPIN